MQVVSPSSPAPDFAGKERFAEVYGKLSDDFSSKLKVGFRQKEEKEEEEKNRHRNLKKSWRNHEESDEEEEEGDEFSFASVNAENSPITAEEAFEDGQIRPVYPLFNRNLLFEPEEKSLRSPLKKLYVESEEAATAEEESEPMGPYCSWSGRAVEEASPETCRKSNSTGFSKLWRFRDLVLRSNSDGKDAFVFLSHRDAVDKNQSSSSSPAATKLAGGKRTEKGKEKTKLEKKMKSKSAHERLYMRNRAIREEGKRKSYLPYKHVGFFTNVNGLTRNVHPF
ncbi:hypothetical protein EUTSA_v10018979mg [Eutrema salsugineum]|uniref:Uncharacterized protein n=1 Tax=Eutrema salsugineum TaxID=72664 RepID=V4KEC7_EUTSA|nr:uncharacterized protein LOC18008090 [Eutrema salsugineum]ESQ28177.1 hypothetical protein EUTSA_v10018979mg [Eutrema salsugineum]